MRIEYDVKLDFKDVLIRPKRSVLQSRADVSLEREFRFKHSGVNWKGVPIVAANMDHTGTLAMAKALSEHQLMTALDKFVPNKDLEKFSKENPFFHTSCFISVGISDNDFEKLNELSQHINFSFICLDAANGYTERYVEFLTQLRKT